MTREEVSALVERELAGYRYEPGAGLLGRPWSAERVRHELATLRAALVGPRRTTLHIEAHAGKSPRTAEAWIVARAAEGQVVAYEPLAGEFWLAWDEEPNGLTTFGVNGDLVGTFMAR